MAGSGKHCRIPQSKQMTQQTWNKRLEVQFEWGEETQVRVIELKAVHTKTLFCENACFPSFWPTVHMDPESTAPEKSTFLKSKNAALPFSCGQRICILSDMMTPSPHPSTSSLQPMDPATSHNNNNNNGGLHACVRAAEDIEPYSPCSWAWVAAAVRLY